MAFLGGALAGIGSIGGGALGCMGASNAASAQEKALQQQIQFQTNVLQNEQQLLSPWYNAGSNALSSLATLLGLPYQASSLSGGATNANALANPATSGAGSLLESPLQFANQMFGTNLGAPTPYNLPQPTLQQFQASPGYQFQLSQGVNAIQNAAGPTQGVLSGNTLQALQKYGTGLANQDWYNWLTNYQNQYNTAWNANNQNYWNELQAGAGQQQNLFNRLLQLSTGGQGAATLTGPQASVTNATGNALGNIGTTQAAGILGQYGGISNALTGLLGSNTGGNTSGGGFGNLLQSLFNNQNNGNNGNSPSGYNLGGYFTDNSGNQ